MKKLTALLAAATLICGTLSSPVFTVKARETTSVSDSAAQIETDVFPDPEARYTVVTENDFEFHVYDEYAVLAEYKNTDAVEVTIPAEVNGVPVVGSVDYPFGYCRKLTSVTLPDSFEKFEWNKLSCTTMVNPRSHDNPVPLIEKIIVSETNPYYTVSDGLLYSKDMKTLLGCPPAFEMKELRISDKTERIGDYAFELNLSLEKADIPSNITHINNAAFAGCLNLKSVVLPESITSISGDMFYMCTSLENVTLKGAVKVIGFGSFNECTALKNFTIPETVEYMGKDVFENSGCIENSDGIHYVGNWVVGCDENCEKIIVRDGTVGISEMAFFILKDVALLEIPNTVKYLGFGMFSNGSIDCCLSTIHVHGSVISQKSFSAAKATTDFYIYDPQCEIFDDEKTIPAAYKVTYQASSCDEENTVVSGDIVIHGYEGSTAQAYAEKYNRKFEVIQSVSGDFNGDGKLAVSDAVMFQKWLLNDCETEISDWKAADLYKDGILDVYDLCIMKQMLINNTL